MKTLLIVGSSRAEAWDFLGRDATPGSPAREDRRSLAVPDNLWPPGPEGAFTAYLLGANGEREGEYPEKFDAVILTRGGCEMTNTCYLRKLYLREGGWIWAEE